MTHAAVSDEVLLEAGINQNLIRLSVGLECSEDLVVDVLAALEAAGQAQASADKYPALTAVAQ
jgi:cystathionine gamma-synthase